jgi:predicted protein tyrosine phosphatase
LQLQPKFALFWAFDMHARILPTAVSSNPIPIMSSVFRNPFTSPCSSVGTMAEQQECDAEFWKTVPHELIIFDVPTQKPRQGQEPRRGQESPSSEEGDEGFVIIDPAQPLAPTKDTEAKEEEDETKEAIKAPTTTLAPALTLTLIPAPEHIPEPPQPEAAEGRNPIDKVQQGLYIGDLRGARHREILREHNITAIVSLVGSHHFRWTQPWFRKAIPKGNHLHIPCLDVPTQDLLPYFGRINNFILNRLVDPSAEKGPNVLVHCAQGISRSAAAVIAFLMMRNSWDYETALKFLREKRPGVRPNKGFEEQLRIWGDVGFDLWEDKGKTVPKGEYAAFLERRDKMLEEAKARRAWVEVSFRARAPVVVGGDGDT